MTKFQLMLTSLVAVIPGAFLCIVLAMAVMSYTMPAMAYAIVGVTLIVAAVVVLMPLGIVISGGRSAAAAKPAAKKAAASKDEVVAVDDEVEVEELSADSVEASEGDLELPSSEFDLGTEDDEEVHLQTEDGIETEPVEEFSDDFELETVGEGLDEFDLDFDEDEDDEPKSKKKKKR